MSFIGRSWRALDAKYDITGTWPITFLTVFLTLTLSIPSLLYYTYGPDDENYAERSYYQFDYAAHWYYLSQPALKALQLWRLPASQFVFPLSAELIFGTPFLLLLRNTEWQLADAFWKRALLLLSVMLLCMGGDALLVTAAGLRVQSGPYWLAFFLLPIYAVHIPSEWSFKLFNKLTISNKAIVYFLALHLLFTLVPASLLAACLPLGLSLLYLLLRFCINGGMSEMLQPNRPQGMRVGRRGESTGHRLGGASLGSGRITGGGGGSDAAARGAPRPVSQYEKLLTNAQAGKAPGSTLDVGGVELEGESQGVVGASGGRPSTEVGYHSRHLQHPTTQDDSLSSPLLSTADFDEASDSSAV